jgi:outer membrane autotransporter protein
LSYGSANTNAAWSVLGVRFLKQGASLLGHPLDWQAELAWEHRLTGTTESLNAAFANAPGQTYQVFGTPSDRDAGRIALGASWQPNQRTTVFAKVGAEIGTSTHDYGVRAGVQWKW